MKIFNRISVNVTNEDDKLIRYIIKHYKYLILIFVLIIIYITNGLIYELEIRRQNELENTLLRSRTRYNMKFMEFIDFYNYKNLIDLSNRYGLGLEEPAQPPIKVEK
jgi:hypothetical protein